MGVTQGRSEVTRMLDEACKTWQQPMVLCFSAHKVTKGMYPAPAERFLKVDGKTEEIRFEQPVLFAYERVALDVATLRAVGASGSQKVACYFFSMDDGAPDICLLAHDPHSLKGHRAWLQVTSRAPFHHAGDDPATYPYDLVYSGEMPLPVYGQAEVVAEDIVRPVFRVPEELAFEVGDEDWQLIPQR